MLNLGRNPSIRLEFLEKLAFDVSAGRDGASSAQVLAPAMVAEDNNKSSSFRLDVFR